MLKYNKSKEDRKKKIGKFILISILGNILRIVWEIQGSSKIGSIQKIKYGYRKIIPVRNPPHLRFVGGNKNQGITGGIYVSYYPEILVAVFTEVDLPVEEELTDIVTNYRKLMIHMECDSEADWVSPL